MGKKRLIDEIYTLASDRRIRIMLEDQNKWLETKLKAIRKLARRLGGEKVKTNKRGEIITVKGGGVR